MRATQRGARESFAQKLADHLSPPRSFGPASRSCGAHGLQHECVGKASDVDGSEESGRRQGRINPQILILNRASDLLPQRHRSRPPGRCADRSETCRSILDSSRMRDCRRGSLDGRRRKRALIYPTIGYYSARKSARRGTRESIGHRSSRLCRHRRIDDRLYGAFLEHLGRAIYSGIYEPGHPTRRRGTACATTSSTLVRDLKVPIVRYPGGNFVSAYNWEDGIGPREKRPTRLDLAWHTSESNAVGLHEFARLVRRRRHGDDARHQPRLARPRRGAQLRRIRQRPDRQLLGRPAQGERPRRAVRRQALVPRQRDGRPLAGRPQDRARIRPPRQRDRQDAARLRQSLELIVCGSSNADMQTYPEWERVVLEHTYEAVDHISLHMYFANREKNTAEYLALNAKLDAYIGTIASTIEFVRPMKRSKKRVDDLLRRVERLVSFATSRTTTILAAPRAGRTRRGCSRTSTISRTCCRSAASSTPSSAVRTS